MVGGLRVEVRDSGFVGDSGEEAAALFARVFD